MDDKVVIMWESMITGYRNMGSPVSRSVANSFVDYLKNDSVTKTWVEEFSTNPAPPVAGSSE